MIGQGTLFGQMSSCPLCRLQTASLYQAQPFYRCETCDLVFKDPALHLSAGDEKARYLTHQNEDSDEGYLNFLRPIAESVINNFSKGARGLDYGSGPSPVLARWLAREGFDVDLYDPFFSPHLPSPGARYDFVVCVEAAEHFYNPWLEFHRIFDLLNPGGSLIISSQSPPIPCDFGNWYYAKDPTHVCFFGVSTWEWLARRLDARLESVLASRVYRLIKTHA